MIFLILLYCCITFTAETPFPFTKNDYHRKFSTEKQMVVIVPSFNNAQWVQNNIGSILMQDYNNYTVIYIADGCDADDYDGTAELVEHLLENSILKNKFTIIKNHERQGALYNLYRAINSCDDTTIIVTLDGDDWFYHNKVLQIINDAYQQRDIWLTHGSFIEYPTGYNHWSAPIDPSIVKAHAYRQFRCPSHCRTFYAWLFKKIKVEDLLLNNKFFPMTWDQAMMFPMIEMCGNHHVFIRDYIYVYNTANQQNDNKVNANFQRNLEKIIRRKKPYASLQGKP